jgi:hypothetical protein
VPQHPYYNELTHTQTLKLGTINITIYQPTTEGAMILCHHYRSKYNINLQCVDLRGRIHNPENALDFFSYLHDNPELLTVSDGKPRGLLLMHGCHHAIPVLLWEHDEMRHMVVFDSSSGSHIKGYFKIANLFDDHRTLFYLNHGTRQSDGASCITDGICILKEALMIEDLMSLINNKIVAEHPCFEPYKGPEGYTPLNLAVTKKPDHFRLFYMPEQLLITAQRPTYLTESCADLSVVLRCGKTLGEYRDHYSSTVTLSKEDGDATYNLNSYLFFKGEEFRNNLNAIYDAEVGKRSPMPTIDERIPSPSKYTSGFFPISPQLNRQNSSPSISAPSR